MGTNQYATGIKSRHIKIILKHKRMQLFGSAEVQKSNISALVGYKGMQTPFGYFNEFRMHGCRRLTCKGI